MPETPPTTGILCPNCKARKWKTVFTRYRVGQTVRVKKCLACGHRVRVRETMESTNAAGRPPA